MDDRFRCRAEEEGVSCVRRLRLICHPYTECDSASTEQEEALDVFADLDKRIQWEFDWSIRGKNSYIITRGRKRPIPPGQATEAGASLAKADSRNWPM